MDNYITGINNDPWINTGPARGKGLLNQVLYGKRKTHVTHLKLYLHILSTNKQKIIGINTMFMLYDKC
jgi:hypothetical protein